jgi:hypothetical protein
MNKTKSLEKSRTRWINLITKNLQEINQNVTFDLVYNRDGWQGIWKAVMVLNGPIS